MPVLSSQQAASASPVVVVPRIKHENFLRAIADDPGMDDSAKPISTRLAGDLYLTYAMDAGSGDQIVSKSTLAQHKVPPYALSGMARANMMPALDTIRMRTDGIVHELTADGNMVACCMLHQDMWQELERQIGGRVLAIFPHRDVVYFVHRDAPQALATLRKILAGIDFNDAHALSRHVYARVNEKWVVEHA